MNCCVPDCDSNSFNRPELSFFSLPKIKSVKREWYEKLGPNLPPSQFVYVCELHFKVNDFRSGPKKELKCHAIPLLKLGRGSTDPVDSEDEFMDQEFVSESKTELPKLIKTIKEEPLSDEECSLQLKPSSSVTCDSGRRPSRRAAIAAAQKISTIAREAPELPEKQFCSIGRVGTIVKANFGDPKLKTYAATPVTPSMAAPSVTPAPSMTPAPVADISLNMECYEEALSETQTEILSEAQNHYNLVMKGLKDLVQCSGKMVQTDSSGTMVLNTLPFPTQSAPMIPPLNPIPPNTLFIKDANSKMIPISLSANTKPSYIFM